MRNTGGGKQANKRKRSKESDTPEVKKSKTALKSTSSCPKKQGTREVTSRVTRQNRSIAASDTELLVEESDDDIVNQHTTSTNILKRRVW
jgi:hypothetical protein